MIAKIINFFKKRKLKKILKEIQVQIKKEYRDLGKKAVMECKEAVARIDSSIFKVNDEFTLLEKEFFEKREELKGKEDELKFYKNDFDEKFNEYKNKLTFTKKKLKGVIRDYEENKEKFKLRLKKENEIQKKFRVLTMFHDRDMNKTLTNLREFLEFNTNEKEALESKVADYKQKIEKLKREKIINFEKTQAPIKSINKTLKTLKAKIEGIEGEREFLLTDIGRKIINEDSFPESLTEDKNGILKLEDDAEKVADSISELSK